MIIRYRCLECKRLNHSDLIRFFSRQKVYQVLFLFLNCGENLLNFFIKKGQKRRRKEKKKWPVCRFFLFFLK